MASTLKVPFSVYVCKSGGSDESNISSFRFEQLEVPSWEDMKAMISAQYDIQNDVLLKHIDVDHEEITIGSQEEWNLAVKAAEKESNQLFLKIYPLPEQKVQLPRANPRGSKCKKEALRSHLLNINSKVDHLTKELSTVKLTQQQQEEVIRQAAIGASQRPSNDSDRQIVHEDILCSLCREPVVGIRFKCTNCSQYNLCEQCEKNSDRSHPETHVFLKLVMPIDRKVDVWISKAPLLGCNLYDSFSVERFLRKIYHRSHRRRHSSSSSGSSTGSSSSSSGSSSDHDSERLRYEMERRRNRRRKHGRTSSNSTSTHDVRRRRKKCRRRRSSSSSSHTSTGSSSTGSSSTSHSASIITLDNSSKRRSNSEMCQYGHRHKTRPCRYHQQHRRRCHDKQREDGSRGHRHRRGHRHHRHRRHGRGEEQPLLSRSSVADVRPPSTFDCPDDEVQQLVDWSNAPQMRRAREIMEQDTIPPETASQRDGLQDVMMTEQEMQQFRERLNKLVDVPKPQEPVDTAEYFVQTGCGLGDWVPITDQPSVVTQSTEGQETITEYSLVEVPSPDKVQEEELIDLDADAPSSEKVPTAPQISTDDQEKAAENTSAVEASAERQTNEPNSEEKGAEQLEASTEPEKLKEATSTAEDNNKLIDTTAGSSDDVIIIDPPSDEVTEQPAQPDPTHPQAQQTPVYPAPHYPQYQQYPVTGAYPVYPYPSYPPPIDGQAAANLWSATTNVLRSMQSGWEGIVGGQNNSPRPAPEVRRYDYQTNKEMQQLVEMGFCNRERNQRLLEKHNQNMDLVVSDLINESNDPWYSNRH